MNLRAFRPRNTRRAALFSHAPGQLPLLGWLVLVWLALWRDVTLATVASGVVIAALLLWVFPIPGGVRASTVRPWAVLRFAAYFLWKLVEATAVVAWEVLTPRNRIVEGIIAVPLGTASATVTMLVANAVSLIPGTLVVEVDRGPTVLYVHVLHLHDLDRARRDVHRLEELARKAFPERGPRAGVAT